MPFSPLFCEACAGNGTPFKDHSDLLVRWSASDKGQHRPDSCAESRQSALTVDAAPGPDRGFGLEAALAQIGAECREALKDTPKGMAPNLF
jgi:hypothetical protein